MSTTFTSLSGAIGCLAAGMGGMFVLATNPPDVTVRRGQPQILSAAVSTPGQIDLPETISEQPSSAEETLKLKVRLLERGRDWLLQRPGYVAHFQKQEVVDGELLDEQAMFLKCRHEPFSVYLLWDRGNVGREVLYIEGENNGKLLAHDGGWKSRLPTMALKPDSNLAMQDARYPVTAAGFLGLINIMLTTHRQDLDQSCFATCEQRPCTGPGERPCLEFTTRYKNPVASPIYRKSITRIDKEWSVPIETRHFEWPKKASSGSEEDLDQTTLIESYRFDEIDFSYQPQAADFDRTNPEYQLQ